MKTVNYFGVELRIPDDAKYVAMDGVHANYQIHWYNQKPVFNKGIKCWEQDVTLPAPQKDEFWYGYISEDTRLTKPKKSLMKLED